jgi:hypothetical protein
MFKPGAWKRKRVEDREKGKAEKEIREQSGMSMLWVENITTRKVASVKRQHSVETGEQASREQRAERATCSEHSESREQQRVTKGQYSGNIEQLTAGIDRRKSGFTLSNISLNN